MSSVTGEELELTLEFTPNELQRILRSLVFR
jgi:hypothetical protein